MDYTQTIDSLYENSQITENMPYSACQSIFLLHMSKTNKIFENLLKKKYLYDLECKLDCSKLPNDFTSENIQSLLLKNFKNRAEYVYVEKISSEFIIFVKFSQEIYSPLKNCDIENFLIPYKLLVFDDNLKLSDFRFNEILFSPIAPKQHQMIYAEFIEHLKSLKMPLKIMTDLLLFENTNVLPTYTVYIYLPETSQWPKDQNTIVCAKTAFYCQMFLKSQFRLAIDKEFCVFKYKGFNFTVKILLKSDFNVKYKMLIQLHDTIKQKGELIFRKAVFLKTLLGKIGVYPLVFDDFIVDLLVLMINKDYIGDSKFLSELANFDFALENKVFDLETLKIHSSSSSNSKTLKINFKEMTYNLNLPSQSYFEDLKNYLKTIECQDKLFIDDEDMIPRADEMFKEDLTKYDFILTNVKRENMKEIIGIVDHNFSLGFADQKDFSKGYLNQFATIHYNPFENTLMVKSKSLIDLNLLKNLIINETSFDYVS